MIKLVDVNKIYSKNNQLSIGIEKVNIKFNIGDFVLVNGPSGEGKSTLINIIAGNILPTSGDMFLNDYNTNWFGQDDWDNYKKNIVSIISQDYDLIYEMTVKNNILLGLFKDYNAKEMNSILRDLKIDSLLNKKVRYLSKGECARVSIARALLKNNPILLIDEGTANLDLENSKIIYDTLKKVSKDKIIIVISHKEEYEDNDFFNRNIIMENNTIKSDHKKNYVEKDIKIEQYIQKKIFPLRLLKYIAFIKPKNKLFGVVITTLVLLISSILCFTIGSLNEGIKYDSTDCFKNLSQDRIILIKNDYSSFTEGDYENLKSNFDCTRIIKNDVLLDIMAEVSLYHKLSGTVTNDYRIDEYYDNIVLENGVNPTSTNQVVLGVKSIPELSNNSLTLYIEDTNSVFLYEVVGFTICDNPTIYIQEESLNEIYNRLVFCNSNKKITIDNQFYENNTTIFYDESIDEGKLVTNIKLNAYFDITIRNDYYEKSLENINSYYDENIVKNYLFEESENYILLSKKDYNKLVTNDKYQISIFIDNVKESTISRLSNDYYVYYPNALNLHKDNSTSMLVGLAFFTIVLIVECGLIVVISISNKKLIQKNFNNDLIYYKFGYRKNNIILCNLINYSIEFVCSMMLSMILINCILNTPLNDYILKYYTNGKNILLYLALFIVIITIQYNFYLKEFKKGDSL